MCWLASTPTRRRSSAKYPRPRSALLPLLHLVQSEEGYVSADGIAYCAAKFGLTEAEVTAVVSFYTMYKRRPVGDYHVGVCTNTLCAVMGGDQIFAELSRAPRRGQRRDHAGRQGHARARGVQRRLRLRAGRDGELGVLRQHDARTRPGSSSTTCAPGTRSARPGARTGCAPGARRPGSWPASTTARPPTARRPARPAWSASSWPRSAAGPRPGPEHVSGDADPLAGAGRSAGSGPAGSGVSHADCGEPPARPVARQGVAVTDTLTPVLTARWDQPDSFTLDGYKRGGGWQALPKALAMEPDDLITALKNANLRGRGGAGFPTGVKWSFLPQGDGKPHYLVVNADESEPGTCKDIPLMMANPQVLIEGVAITAYAIRAKHAFIYVRGEVLHVVRRLRHAVEEAYAAGYLGQDILGTGFDLDVIVHAGAGAYICGEESALLTSLEGFRGLPRLRPPFPAVAGLYACPTVINNVESIASVPSIVANGADWFAGLGTEKSKGFGIFSLSGHVTTPGPVRGAARHHAARAARPGRRGAGRAPAEVLDPGRLVHPAADRPAPGRAAGLRVGRRRRVHARHPGAADLRRDHLRGPRGAALDRVLRARVVRQVHAVPGGDVLDGQGARTAGTRPGHRGRPGETPGHLRQHPRPGVLRPGRRRDQPDHLGHPVLQGRVHAAPEGRRLPVRPGGLDPVCGGLGGSPPGASRGATK